MQCQFKYCDREYYAKGWCGPHYLQSRNGRPMGPIQTVSDDPLVRFSQKIELNSNGCWIWQGAVSSHGYGSFKAYGQSWMAHRYALYAFENVYMTANKYVCHHCDTPLCVRPDHLFVGTSSDNAKNREAKSRGRNQKHQPKENRNE